MFAEVIPQSTLLLADPALVEHNARFDVSFLRIEYGRAGWGWPACAPALCTLAGASYFCRPLSVGAWRTAAGPPA